MRYFFILWDGRNATVSRSYASVLGRDKEARRIAEEQAYSDETEDTVMLLDVPEKGSPTVFPLNA